MPATAVRDLTLLLDSVCEDGRWRYTAALFEGWPEEERQPIEQPLAPFYDMLPELRKASSDESWGAALFDWAFPPGSKLRETFLRCCEKIEREGNLLRLWISIGPSLTSDPYFQLFERVAKVSWEGFWVQEWADGANRPSRVQSPFLALNPWIHILRRPPGVSVQRRFTVPGRLNVLIIVSNPPPPGSGEWKHIEHLEREDGSGMLRRVYRPFHWHRGVGWVYVLRNPTKVGLAQCIREHRPHVVIYLGHGYTKKEGSGLVLAVTEGGKDFEEVSGLRKFPEVESELEQVLAGKVEALSHPGAQDVGLPVEDRPRLFIALSCVVAFAAPAILRSGIPAVLAMRVDIPDSDSTEAMFKHCADVITNEAYSIEEAVADLRRFLREKESRFADGRLHFSVPVLHLAPTGMMPVQ